MRSVAVGGGGGVGVDVGVVQVQNSSSFIRMVIHKVCMCYCRL